ncbi:MAG: hypothetical protein ABR968_14325 [Bacteroidales bacterium]|jgi:hypothetical protein
MRITNIQKKELSDIFRESGLNVLDFETTGQYKEFKIKFKHDYYSFSLNIQKDKNYYLTIFPIDNTQGYSVGATWTQTKNYFAEWTMQLATDLNTATGWETFQSHNFLNADFKELAQEFSETEKEQVRQSIKELKEKIKTLVNFDFEMIRTICRLGVVYNCFGSPAESAGL